MQPPYFLRLRKTREGTRGEGNKAAALEASNRVSSERLLKTYEKYFWLIIFQFYCSIAPCKKEKEEEEKSLNLSREYSHLTLQDK